MLYVFYFSPLIVFGATYFSTCATVFGPNHSPTRLSSESPIKAIWCIENGLFRLSSNLFTIFKYVGSLQKQRNTNTEEPNINIYGHLNKHNKRVCGRLHSIQI